MCSEKQLIQFLNTRNRCSKRDVKVVDAGQSVSGGGIVRIRKLERGSCVGVLENETVCGRNSEVAQ